MNWLNKDLQIGILTMLEMQDTAYKHFAELYAQDLALEHTRIFMNAMALLAKHSNEEDQ
jgi:hypothetical protein